MSGEGQNVYPVEKLCAGWVCPILRDTHLVRQHLVVLPTRCDQGNTQQVSGAWRQGNRASEAFDECSQEVIAPSCLFELHAV
jgi:hypothetical protein